jgi:hypothetical protein
MYTKEEYEAKRAARYERLKAAAERAAKESAAAWSQARDMAAVIPFGQPIHVGHHSEKADRNYRARIENKHRRGYELHKKAAELDSRAESIKRNQAIFSDDPEASEKIADKIARLEARQQLMKDTNAAIKKQDRARLAELGYTEKAAERLLTEKDCFGGLGFARFELSNNGANIRRLKERAAIIEKKQATADSEHTMQDGTRIQYAPSENRIRIWFTARVPADVYKSLRQHGFRVSPSLGDFAFSAYYNNNARYFVRNLMQNEPKQ